jgi:hypothetical protein
MIKFTWINIHRSLSSQSGPVLQSNDGNVFQKKKIDVISLPPTPIKKEREQVKSNIVGALKRQWAMKMKSPLVKLQRLLFGL